MSKFLRVTTDQRSNSASGLDHQDVDQEAHAAAARIPHEAALEVVTTIAGVTVVPDHLCLVGLEVIQVRATAVVGERHPLAHSRSELKQKSK